LIAKNLRGALAPLLTLSAAVLGIGCGAGSEMSKQEIANFKNPPPMTDENRKQLSTAMATGATKELDHEKQWRSDHPAEAAKMDAERAAHGLPPIGK